MSAIESAYRSLNIPNPSLTVTTVRLRVAGDFPEAFSNELNDINDAVVELAVEIARGQDKIKTLDILKKQILPPIN